MANYTFTINGKSRPISAKTFWIIALTVGLPILAVSLFIAYVVFKGLFLFGGFIAIAAYLITFARLEVTLNHTKRVFAVIRNEFLRGVLGTVVSLAAGAYGFIHLFR